MTPDLEQTLNLTISPPNSRRLRLQFIIGFMVMGIALAVLGVYLQFEYVLKMPLPNAAFAVPVILGGGFGTIIGEIYFRFAILTKSMQRSRRSYQRLVERSPTGIALIDDGIVLYINRAGLKILQAQKTDILGKRVVQFIHPQDRDYVERGIRDIVYGDAQNPLEELRLVRIDGETIYAELSNSRADFLTPTAIQTAFIDITPRKRMEAQREQLLQAYRQLNEISHLLGQNLALPIALPDIIRLTVELVDAQSGALAMVTDDSQDLTIYPFFRGMPPIDPIEANLPNNGLVRKILQSGQPIFTNDYAGHAHSQSRWAKMGVNGFIGAPIVAGTTNVGVLMVFATNTEPPLDQTYVSIIQAVGRQAGIAIENSRLYAKEVSRTEALQTALTKQAELDRLKSEFVRNVSHELRTPLTIANGHLELLLIGEFGDLAPAQHNFLQTAAQRLNQLIQFADDLIGILTVEEVALKLEPVNLAELVETTIKEFEPLTKQHGIKLEANIECDLPLSHIDRRIMHRVLDNLLSNAIKFTASGSINVRLWRDKDCINLAVTDTGIGIAPQHLDLIFDRFYQVDGSSTRRYGGTGLGLALVKEAIEAQNGTIFVESQVNHGSRFLISLPITKERISSQEDLL